MCTNPLNDYFAMAGHNPRFASNSTALRRWVQLHGKRGDTPAAAARLLPMMIAAAPTAVNSAPRRRGRFRDRTGRHRRPGSRRCCPVLARTIILSAAQDS